MIDKKELIKQLMVAERQEPTTKVATPSDVVPLLTGISKKKEENFYIVMLDGQHGVIGRHHVTKGIVNRTLVHPREVFRAAIRKNAVAIIIAHNHPSGNVIPSAEDKEITKRLCDAGGIIGIPVLDHIIVSAGGFYSFLETGTLPK